MEPNSPQLSNDTKAPTVVAIDPSNNAVNVTLNKVINVTFSEPIKSGNYWIELKDNNGTLVPIKKSIKGNTLTITPLNTLIQGMKYLLIIHTGSITDMAGNNITLYTTHFTTTFDDTTAPTVKVIDPSNNAVNVAVNKVINVTFSEPIKSGNYWIELKDSNGTLVPIKKSIKGNTLTITPLNTLIQGMKYLLIIHTGSITDMAGNNITLYTTHFTTVPSPVVTFTSAQILDASARVKAYVDSNNKLPSYVTIGSTNVSMAQFLQMMSIDLLQINNGANTPIVLPNVNSPSNPTDTVRTGQILKTEYLNMAQRIKSFIDSNNVAPNYVSSSLGNVQFDSAVYMYSRILTYYEKNNALPNYASIYPWSTITTAYKVYITSDNIYNTATDTANINKIINGLAALGVSAVEYGIGPNTHDAVLESSVPQNAVVVDIYGGACAGTIYEMGTSWYKSIKGTRDVFTVFWADTSADITNLAWLPRAHDDDFSRASFTGLAHPDQYMLNNGYRYIYSSDIQAIVNSIYKETLR